MSRFFAFANALILVAAVLLVVIGIRQSDWLIVVVAGTFALGSANGLRARSRRTSESSGENEAMSVKAAALFGSIFGAAVGFAAQLGKEPATDEWFFSVLVNSLGWAFVASIAVWTSNVIATRLR